MKGRGDNEKDRSLIDGYLAGRPGEARRVERWIRSTIARYAGLATETEDLIQLVHLKVIDNLRAGRFRYESSFSSYVISIAHFTCIDLLRGRHLTGQDELPDDLHAEWGDPYLALERAERRQILYLAFRRTPESCRRLWRMIFLEGMRYEEIASTLGIPVGTVKSRVFACRSRLVRVFRKLLGPRGDRTAARRRD